jgi:hypothetical protein
VQESLRKVLALEGRKFGVLVGMRNDNRPVFRPSSQFIALSLMTTKVVSGLGSLNCCFSLQCQQNWKQMHIRMPA